MKWTGQLTLTEVKFGLLYVKGRRDLFPDRGQPVVIIDAADREKFSTKMHSSQPRIDGLTRLHEKYKTRPGDKVTISVSLNNRGFARVRFQSQGGIEVRIDPEVLDVFSDGSSINEVLRALAPIMRRQVLAFTDPHLLIRAEKG